MTTITAVNKIQAATLAAYGNGNDDRDIVYYNSNTTTDNDNEQEVHKEGE